MEKTKRCRVLSVISQKGGVGKSATATQLAVGLARKKHKVLFIDADPQGTGSMMLGIAEPDELEESIASVLTKIINEEPISDSEAILHTVEDVHLLPANIDLASMEVTLVNTMNRERILKQYVDQQRSNYDYIIIDTPPALGILTINALTACDSVIIPAQADIYSLQGIEQLAETMKPVKKYCNPALNIAGILLTRYSQRAVLSREVAEIAGQLAARLGTRIFNTAIRENISVKEAQISQTSLFDYAPNSNAAKDYRTFIEELLEAERSQ